MIFVVALGTPIATYGSEPLTLDFGQTHKFPWVFVITEVTQLILDLDFLRYYELLLDAHNCVAVLRLGLIASRVTNGKSLHNTTIYSHTDFVDLLKEFSSVILALWIF